MSKRSVSKSGKKSKASNLSTQAYRKKTKAIKDYHESLRIGSRAARLGQGLLQHCNVLSGKKNSNHDGASSMSMYSNKVRFEDPADRNKFCLKPELSAEYQAKLGNFEGKVVKFATKVLGADKDMPKEEITENLLLMNETVPLRGSHFHTLSNKIARELRTDQSRLSDIEKSSKGTKEKTVNVDHSLVEKFNLALNEIAGFPEPTPSDQDCSMSSDSMSACQNQDDGIASALQLDGNFSVGRSAGFRSVNLENKFRRRFDGSLSPMDKLISKIIEENEEDDFGSTCAKKFGHSLPKIDIDQLSGVSIGIMQVNSSRVLSSKFNTERGASRRVSETHLGLSPTKKNPRKLSLNHMKSLDNLGSTKQILKKKKSTTNCSTSPTPTRSPRS